MFVHLYGREVGGDELLVYNVYIECVATLCKVDGSDAYQWWADTRTPDLPLMSELYLIYGSNCDHYQHQEYGDQSEDDGSHN